MPRIADPQVFPDSKWMAYTVTADDKESNVRNSGIWLLPASSGKFHQLTRSPSSSIRPPVKQDKSR
jgi:hypothetical protein